jgi:hypothetical protein
MKIYKSMPTMHQGLEKNKPVSEIIHDYGIG